MVVKYILKENVAASEKPLSLTSILALALQKVIWRKAKALFQDFFPLMPNAWAANLVKIQNTMMIQVKILGTMMRKMPNN